MKTYDVTIMAKVIKTYRVEADDEDAAYDRGHKLFCVMSDGAPGDYGQDSVDCVEVEKESK